VSKRGKTEARCRVSGRQETAGRCPPDATANAREELISKELATKQAAYIFVSFRQRLLHASCPWQAHPEHQRAKAILTEMAHELLKELKDFPQRVTDPKWLETLEKDEGK
jgi:hypothetical protein